MRPHEDKSILVLLRIKNKVADHKRQNKSNQNKVADHKRPR